MKSSYEENYQFCVFGNINKKRALKSIFAISLKSFGPFIKNIIFIINVVIRIFQVVAVSSGARSLTCNPSILINMAMTYSKNTGSIYYIWSFPRHVLRCWGEFEHDKAYASRGGMAIYSAIFASRS
jgi:hypothetical protein